MESAPSRGGPTGPDARAAQAVVQWRRATFDLYRRARDEPDPRVGHELWRTGRDALFATSPASPLLPDDAASFDGLPVADYDPQWRFHSRIEQAEPMTLSVGTGTDGVVTLERIGLVRLPGVGSLDLWRHVGYGGGLFVPIKDGGAGTAGGTYGGGRYLIDTIKGADLGGDDGHLVLDLNFAYNPSCAYDPRWACPLAPAGNTVDVAIPVGEHYRTPLPGPGAQEQA